MDNIGFTELVLLGVIALVVLGPEKLPGAIRTASLWIGRLKRSFNSIKTDIEREIGADEIRRQLRNEAIMEKFKATKAQVDDAMSTVRKTTDEIRKTVELEAKAIETATAPVTTPTPAAITGTEAASVAAGAAATTTATATATETTGASLAPATEAPAAPAAASTEPAASVESDKTP
jgi:sec-independent protein translocase protein TatB